jgi:S1-C subfamily serine protease
VRQLDLPTDVRGVVVTDVDDSSPAAGRIATPQTGGPDVILSVEGQAVTSPEGLRAALGSAKAGDIVSLRIYNAQAKNRRIERVRLGSSPRR